MVQGMRIVAGRPHYDCASWSGVGVRIYLEKPAVAPQGAAALSM